MSVLSIYSLPDVLYSKLRTTTVNMREDGGVICLEPAVRAKSKRNLRGMFAGCGVSVDSFLENMRSDKEAFEQ